MDVVSDKKVDKLVAAYGTTRIYELDDKTWLTAHGGTAAWHHNNPGINCLQASAVLARLLQFLGCPVRGDRKHDAQKHWKRPRTRPKGALQLVIGRGQGQTMRQDVARDRRFARQN